MTRARLSGLSPPLLLLCVPAAQDSFRNEMQISRRSFLVKSFFFTFCFVSFTQFFLLKSLKQLFFTIKTPSINPHPGQSDLFITKIYPPFTVPFVTFEPLDLFPLIQSSPSVYGVSLRFSFLRGTCQSLDFSSIVFIILLLFSRKFGSSLCPKLIVVFT